MGWNALSEIITIMAAIVTIIGTLWAIIRGPQPSLLVNIITILMIAIGVAAVIYGGISFDSVYTKLNSEEQSCIALNSFYSSRSCAENIHTRYNENVNPVLGNIGLGLILIVSAFFIRKLKSAS